LRNFVCTLVLFFGVTAARADVFSFSFTGTDNASGSGTITATANGHGGYTVTGFSGVEAYQGFLSPTSLLGASLTSLTSGSLTFGAFSIPTAVLTFSSGTYVEGGLPTSVGTFRISSVPEAATLSLLFAMSLGVWAFARKLPAKKQL
jgi:hypothetical protein